MKFEFLIILIIVFVLPPTLSASPAAGDSITTGDSIPMYWMDDIVVTAKKTPSLLENLAMSISIIGRKEIELSTANSSTDIAGSLPGVFIQRTGSFGRSDVNIRGLGSRGRRAGVLVDGRPERMALFDCTVTHSFLLHDVERVEVIRGPSSVLYGSGAMGGVLNVIPREAKQDMEIDLKTAAGSYKTTVTSARAGRNWGRIRGSVSVDYRRSDGHVDHSGYEGTDLISRAGINLAQGLDLTISGKYFDGFKEEPVRATDDPGKSSDIWNDYKRGSVDVHFKGKNNKAGFSARYYRNFGEHNFSDGWHSRDATNGVMIYAAGHPVASVEVSGGVDYRFQQGKKLNSPAGDWDKWETGVYLAAEYNLRDYAVISGGLRFNRDEKSGAEVCPAFGILGRPWKGASVRALASKGFRAPQINELYMFPPSNEKLEAETMWSYELGLRQKASDLLVFDIAVFRMDGENFIESGRNPDPPPMFLFQNTGTFEFLGFEASVNANWRDILEGRFSYSYLDPGSLTRGRPGRKYDLSAAYTYDRFSLHISGSHVDDYYAGNDHEDKIDAYTLFSLHIVSELAKGVSAFVSVENVFNEDYALFVDLPGGSDGLYTMPGRNFLFGLKYGLQISPI